MRSWLPAVLVFAAALAAGNFILGPLYCRGEFAIPYLDRAAVCLAPNGFSRSASALYYFASVAFAMFVGIVADKLPRRAAPAAPEAKPAAAAAPAKEQVEPAVIAPLTPSVEPTPKVEAAATPAVAAPVVAAPAMAVPPPPPLLTPMPMPEPQKVDFAQALEDALKSQQPPPAPKPAPAVVAVTPPQPSPLPPAPSLPPMTKPAEVAKPWRQQKAFEGTNDELIARFKELGKEGGIEAIATAQRNLDESTLAGLGVGIDPKQHLSQIAHLLLVDDPDLKSEVARGVLVHIAARLKELGVAAPLKPGAA